MEVLVEDVLEREEWLRHAEAHAARVDQWVQPHLERRRRHEKHPVHDFLFTYYSHRPSALRRWHPGYGVTLRDAPEYDELPAYEGGTVTSALLHDRERLVRDVHTLLAATERRAPRLGCFGLHEWAMVHDAERHGTRHDLPLRLGARGTDQVVESHRIACSHFDAYRFFTPSARPLNTLSPGRDDRVDFEQPACLHAGMDLYKHAFRLSPLIPSELVADCFALAVEIRELDMRASPYDLTGVTDLDGAPYSPVRIETPAGKQTYAAAQQRFAERGAPLRSRLISECDRLLRGPGERGVVEPPLRRRSRP